MEYDPRGVEVVKVEVVTFEAGSANVPTTRG